MCHLHEHHDHMKEVLERKFNEMAIMKSVVVADDVCQDFAKRSSGSALHDKREGDRSLLKFLG